MFWQNMIQIQIQMRPDSPRDFGAIQIIYLLTYLLTYLQIKTCKAPVTMK